MYTTQGIFRLWFVFCPGHWTGVDAVLKDMPGHQVVLQTSNIKIGSHPTFQNASAVLLCLVRMMHAVAQSA